MDRYDEALEIVVAMSKVKMTLNSHKGRIERCTGAQIRDMGKAEFDELYFAMLNDEHIKTIEEAADVLNFAVAAVQQAIHSYRHRKETHHERKESYKTAQRTAEGLVGGVVGGVGNRAEGPALNQSPVGTGPGRDPSPVVPNPAGTRTL